MTRIYGILILALAAVTLVTACSDSVSPPRGHHPVRQLRALPALKTLDDILYSVAELDRAFSGLYFDSSGTLVVRVTSAQRSASVLEALRSSAASQLISGVGNADAAGRVRIEVTQFSFAELKRWRDEIYHLRPQGLTYLDVDERGGTVISGFASEDHRAAGDALLRLHGFPPGAVASIVRPRPTRQARLTDRVRPIDAGIVTVGALQCTIGANAQTDDGLGFITASHCTDENWFGGVQGRAFYQDAVGSGNLVGFEAADPTLLPPGDNCSAPDGCRYSDAAWIAFEFSAADSANFGMIARTTNFSGSTTINSSKPRFVIKDAPFTFLAEGAQVYKIGITGAQTGTVNDTCVDHLGWYEVPGDSVTADLLCEWQATYISNNGDSGGPVFSWDGIGDSVTFRGLHVGLDSTLTYPLFSPWRFISLEFSGVVQGLSVSVGGEEGPGGPG